jgi:hypothetical protein
MSSAGVRFGRTTCGGWESDTFARLLGRLLGLLIAIDYDGIRMRCDAMQYKSSQSSGMWHETPEHPGVNALTA